MSDAAPRRPTADETSQSRVATGAGCNPSIGKPIEDEIVGARDTLDADA